VLFSYFFVYFDLLTYIYIYIYIENKGHRRLHGHGRQGRYLGGAEGRGRAEQK